MPATTTTTANPNLNPTSLPKARISLDQDLDHDRDHDFDEEAHENFIDKDQGQGQGQGQDREMLLYERIARGRMSAVANKDDFSTIFMTCSALTSRAGGSFSVTRSSVEFSIGCGGLPEEVDEGVRTRRAANSEGKSASSASTGGAFTEASGAGFGISLGAISNNQATANTVGAGVGMGVGMGVGVVATPHMSTNLSTTHGTTLHGIKDKEFKTKPSLPSVPLAEASPLAGLHSDPHLHPHHSQHPNNYPYDISKIRVCIVAESSDVASSIPG